MIVGLPPKCNDNQPLPAAAAIVLPEPAALYALERIGLFLYFGGFFTLTAIFGLPGMLWMVCLSLIVLGFMIFFTP